MKTHLVLSLAAVGAVIPLLAAAPTALAPVPVRADSEERLSSAIQALPPEQRAMLRVSRRSATVPEEPISAVMRPGAFKTLRAQHIVPRDRVTSDPSITLRYVRKVDAICTVLPAEARRAADLDDGSCAAAKARLGR